MNVIMSNDNTNKYQCESCRAEFPNKTSVDRHALFCKTLAGIRRGGGVVDGITIHNSGDDPLLPTQREMFILIQELALKYNKVKDELDVMKQWAKMVGRRISGGTAAAAAAAGGTCALDFTSITRQKRQNIEATLNEEDEELVASAAATLGAENPISMRPSFTEWLAESVSAVEGMSSSATAISLSEADLNVVFNEDLIAGITAAILRVLAGYTAESGRAHLIPFKLSDIKHGAFYVYDTPFSVGSDVNQTIATDPPTRKWRIMETCEFQLFVNTIHKLLFKEFKKWQDRNWDAQNQIMKDRKKAVSSYNQVMRSYQCSPAMASCDGMYAMPSCVPRDDDEPVSGATLSEDFATLYNKYADKMLGGKLEPDTILTRVRAKLWKDMKAWRL